MCVCVCVVCLCVHVRVYMCVCVRDLIDGSQAAGVLVIAYSVMGLDIHYNVAPRNGQLEQAVLTCLPGQSYNVLLYVISEKGLPLHHFL